MRSDAPWTRDQVKELNRWQTCGWVHPFTCARRGDGHHVVEGPLDDLGQLIATESGWICPNCDYMQTWAHDFMLDGPPPNPFADGSQPG